MAQQKYETFYTPVGVFQYPNFNKARDFQGNGKFKYDGTLVLPVDTLNPLTIALHALLSQKFAEAEAKLGDLRSCPFKIEKDDNGNEFLHIKFSVNQHTGDWHRKPQFIDAQGQVIEGDEPRIGAGTKAAVSFQIYADSKGGNKWFQLQPMAVQIIDLVERGGDYAGGFEKHDGGFESSGFSDQTTEAPAPAAQTSGNGQSSRDF